jgi:hypothetical protein
MLPFLCGKLWRPAGLFGIDKIFVLENSRNGWIPTSIHGFLG